MTTTKLDLVNRVLDSAGERRVTATTGALALIVEDCIQLAIDEIATSANWSCLQVKQAAESWSEPVATLSTDEVYRVRGVSTRNDSTSYPFDVTAKFCSQEEFNQMVKYSWTGANTDLVRYWTYYVGDNTVRVNPYPADDDAKASVLFEFYTIPTVPSEDNGTYSPPDRWMRMVELRASAIFALKHLSNDKLHTIYNREYMELKRRLLANDTGLPSGGYSMYRGNRGRNLR